jgi:hypothetical protein
VQDVLEIRNEAFARSGSTDPEILTWYLGRVIRHLELRAKKFQPSIEHFCKSCTSQARSSLKPASGSTATPLDEHSRFRNFARVAEVLRLPGSRTKHTLSF